MKSSSMSDILTVFLAYSEADCGPACAVFWSEGEVVYQGGNKQERGSIHRWGY